MPNKTPKKILLFNKKRSAYFTTGLGDFKKIIHSLNAMSPTEIEVIDADENPELAEKYRIDALPTLIIGNKRYIGRPSPKKAIEILKGEV